MSRADDAATDGGLLRIARRGLQLTLVALAVYGAVASVGGMLVNAVLALAVTALPDAIEWRYDHDVDPRLALWIAAAAVIHSAGFLGPYGASTGLLSWYDKFAHVVSASFVAGVGYAVVEALDRGSDRIRFPGEFRFAFTIAIILAVGVAWEIAEFGTGWLSATLLGNEMLVQYGVEDVVGDLTFNALGAVLVALWGTDYFDGVAASISRRVFDGNRS